MGENYETGIGFTLSVDVLPDEIKAIFTENIEKKRTLHISEKILPNSGGMIDELIQEIRANKLKRIEVGEITILKIWFNQKLFQEVA